MVVIGEKMRRFAGGNARKRARLHEIGSWFADKAEMKMEAQAVLDGLIEEEEESLFGRAMRSMCWRSSDGRWSRRIRRS